MIVRPCEDGDLPAIAALLATDGFGEDGPKRIQAAWVSLRPFSLVATPEGNIAGVLLATFNGWHIFASHLIVLPIVQRQGIGRMLVEKLVLNASGAGVKGIVADARLSAVGFFHALGFRLPGAVFLIRDLPSPA
jgi:N-acetylglutamate synthase-like GNAT family acetyltransferase